MKLLNTAKTLRLGVNGKRKRHYVTYSPEVNAISGYIFPDETLDALETLRNNTLAEGKKEGPYVIDISVESEFVLGAGLEAAFSLGFMMGARPLKPTHHRFSVYFSYDIPAIFLAEGGSGLPGDVKEYATRSDVITIIGDFVED